MNVKTKLLIIGSGPAGYTAGIYAVRAGLETTLVAGTQIGGQLTLTSEIENFPGFVNPIHGGELMQNMRDQALNLGVNIIEDYISEVELSKKPFICKSDRGTIYEAESIIIATGASAKWPKAKNIDQFIGFGVSACATCDGFFYRNKDVIVVGGGNTAAMEALHLSHVAKSVTLIHRRDKLRADKVMQDRVFNNPKIKCEWDSSVEEVLGSTTPLGVEAAVIENLKTGKRKTTPIDGIFISIGNRPNTDLFKDQLDLDENGYIKTLPDSTQTNIPGVFAAGDVQNPRFKQAILAAASGCQAALEAEAFINDHN